MRKYFFALLVVLVFLSGIANCVYESPAFSNMEKGEVVQGDRITLGREELRYVALESISVMTDSAFGQMEKLIDHLTGVRLIEPETKRSLLEKNKEQYAMVLFYRKLDEKYGLELRDYINNLEENLVIIVEELKRI